MNEMISKIHMHIAVKMESNKIVTFIEIWKHSKRHVCIIDYDDDYIDEHNERISNIFFDFLNIALRHVCFKNIQLYSMNAIIE